MRGWLSFTTVVLFTAFVAMCVLLFWPTRTKPYKDAGKIALKEDNDPPITPRDPDIHHERNQP